MGRGLSALTDRRTHNTLGHARAVRPHLRSAALRGPHCPPIRRPQFPARPGSLRRPHLPGFRRGKRVRPGGAAGLERPRSRTEQRRQQVTAGLGPLAGGRAGRGWWAGLAPLPAGPGPGLTPGSLSGCTGQSRAAQAWPFLSGPSWARLQPRPVHAPGPVEKGQRCAKAAVTHLRRPAPAPGTGRSTGQSGGRMSPGGTSPGRTSPVGEERRPGCPKAAQASARVFVPVRQFPGTGSSLLLPPPVITLGIGGRPILFSSKKKKKRNQIGGGSVT